MKDLADPRYNGRFTIRSTGGEIFSQAVLGYEPREVVEIARGWGKNGVVISDTGDGGTVKVGLGEVAIAAQTSEGQFTEAQAAGNPVARAYFQDNVHRSVQYYVVRKGAPHPNLAKLWAIFSASPQAFSVWKKREFLNSEHPDQSPRSAEGLKWLSGTDEGRAHQQAVREGLAGR